MGFNPDPRRLWRATDHTGRADGRAQLPPPTDTPREISVVFYPMRDTTLAVVLARSRAGDRRWDRREGTLICEVPAVALEGLLVPQQLRLLLRAAAESLG